jgi:peroxiredoxin (alkyl hydroperoxide reductase subunit C)
MLKVGEVLSEDLKFDAFVNGDEAKVDLSEKGKWKVLIFYPADFTFICPTELGEVAELYESFRAEGAEVFSVSTDTVFSHKAWYDRSDTIKKIRFPMVADPTGKLCKLFGTYIESEGLSLRGSFIIDPDNKVKIMEMNDNSVGRNATELLRKLQASKFVYDNGEVNVCPASWRPGKDTLKPGMDLVGAL